MAAIAAEGLASGPLVGSQTPGVASAAPVDAAAGGLRFLDALALLLQGCGRWIRHSLPRTLLFGAVGFVVGWLCNVILLAVVYNGVGSAPPGGPALGPNNRAGGSVFWLLLPALISGLVSYRMQVGRERFRADIRGFPRSMVTLVRSEPSASTERLLWGFGGAMLVAALLAPALSGLFAMGALVLAGKLLRPVFGAAISGTYRATVARFAPTRQHPPSEVALQVALLGSAIALLGGLLVTNPLAKLGLAVVAIAAAVLFNRRVPAARQAAVATLVIGGAVMLAMARASGALACDGGLADCGGSVTAWLACGAGPVLSFANQAAILAGGGSLLGGGVGGFDPHQWDNPRLKAAQDWRRQNPNAPWSDFYDTSQGPTALDNFRDQYFGSAGFYTLQNLGRTAQWMAQVGDGVISAFTSIRDAGDFWFTPDSVASPETRALREAMMKDIWGTNVEGAKAAMMQMADMYNTLLDAVRRQDGDTVQKILANFGGAQLGGALIGVGQEAVMARAMAAVRAAQGLDIAGKPLPPPGATDPDPVPPPRPDRPPGAPDPAATDVTAHDHVVSDIPMDARQEAMLNHKVADTVPNGPPPQDPITGEVTQNINTVFKVEFDNGEVGFYKPLSGEDATFTGTGAYGEMWRSEVGAYHVDQALGFNRVPVTAAFEGKSGVGSIQEMAPGDRLPSGGYTEVQQQQMGVLDYVLGNGDRHLGNWVSHADGSPAAIDNGASFPDPAAATNPDADIVIRSDFVLDSVGKPLDPAVVDAVRQVDQGALADQLRANGVSESAINQSMARLQEIADNGKITGQTWQQQGGGFLDSAKTRISYNLNDWIPLK
jgi:hypothetical protein